MLKVLVFWDYDTQWGADRSRLPGGKKDWGHLEFSNTETLLELHAKYEVPSCFAVVGAAALPGQRPYHDPEQIRRIDTAGHEVGSHMLKHEWIPGIGKIGLKESLKNSKEALENCIGKEVVSFVPPYNQPFDFPRRLSFSVAERRAVRKDRIDIVTMCSLLKESGYKFSRISYQNVFKKIGNKILGKPIKDAPSQIENIQGIECLKLNTRGGFLNMGAQLEECLTNDGYFIAYGHPHSITSNNAQNVVHLEEFLIIVQRLKKAGKIEVVLPRDILHGH